MKWLKDLYLTPTETVLIGTLASLALGLIAWGYVWTVFAWGFPT